MSFFSFEAREAPHVIKRTESLVVAYSMHRRIRSLVFPRGMYSPVLRGRRYARGLATQLPEKSRVGKLATPVWCCYLLLTLLASNHVTNRIGSAMSLTLLLDSLSLSLSQ